jgi:outer membrane protein assembly factor BamA
LTRAASVPATLLALAGIAVLASPALAQETREEAVAIEQAAKAAAVQAYQPDALEQKLDRVDGLLFVRRNVYSFIGSPFPGAGPALGPGYRTRFADTGRFDTHAAWSVKNYKAADAAVTLPRFADRRVTIAVRANWLDAPDVAFYGTGIDSAKGARAGYSYTTRTAGVSGRVELAPHVAIGAAVDAVATDATFLGETHVASGFGRTVDPTYRRAHLFAEVDSRTSPGYTRRGGLYRVDWADHHQTNGNALNFRRVDAEVQQFVPLLRENWIIALRALASTTSTAAGQQVPYFMLPDLGGSHTLRGYSAWRFRDRNRVLMSAEYRWVASPFVDMSLFLDAGTAAARVRDLDGRNLRKSYGLGMSMHTPSSTVTRIELAKTREGLSLGLSFSPSF